MEPLLDTDDADANEAKPSAPDAGLSPSAGRAAAANKRKASALSQEVHAQEPNQDTVSDSLDEVSKRLKRDEGQTTDEAPERTVKEGSPSSVSSSRRTSPRMLPRRVAAAEAA